MIRFFAALCKTTLESLSDDDTFNVSTTRFNPNTRRCPKCGTKGKLSYHSKYTRDVVSINDNDIVESKVSPPRYECGSCVRTHALLPANIIPYSPYSLRFKLTVLIAYFERGCTVVEICGRFGIAVSTLYEWKRWFLEHKALWLGALADLKTLPLAFARNLLTSTRLGHELHDFFSRFSYSFMQTHRSKATRAHPP